MQLIDVYADPPGEGGLSILYRLLQERDETSSISHRTVPTWERHKNFVLSRPYKAWYLIAGENEEPVGAIYLTQANELGVSIRKDRRRRGYGTWAMRALMAKHGWLVYLANVNPRNEASIAMVTALGFRHIQNTYQLGKY
jgi:RimJ/RimL family protein N-acetyltransferase